MTEPVEFRVVAFTDVEPAIDRFVAGSSVVLDLTDADEAVQRRVVDFIAGVAYERGRLTTSEGKRFTLTPLAR